MPLSRTADSTVAAARISHRLTYAKLVEATQAFTDAERRRASEKMDAVVRLASQPHPANASKQISISQAEDFAQLDPAYLAYKRECDRLSAARLLAEHEVEAAKLAVLHALAS